MWIAIALLLVSSAMATTVTLRPNGAGTRLNWANTGCSAGASEWQCVDEAVLNTSDYLTDTSTVNETFLFENLNQASAIVNSVKISYHAVQQTNSKNRCFVAITRQSGRDYLVPSSYQCVNGSYVTISKTMTTNPATGSAWTPSEVDALEAGMDSTNPHGGGRVAQVWVDVDYTIPFDFAVSVKPTSASVEQARSTTTTTNVSLVLGATENVNLSVQGCPSGASCTLSVGNGNPSFTSILNVSTSSGTSAGTYPINVTGKSAGLTRVATYTLTVTDLQPNAVNASGSPTSGLSPLTVNFTGSFSGGNAPFTFLWDFKDGTNSTNQNPSHTFNAGTYNATFTVTDYDGDSSTKGVLITVTADNSPIANGSGSPTSGLEPLQVAFTGNFQPGNGPHSTLWQFQDGTNSSSQTVNHSFSAGTYNVSFTVTDNDNDASTNYVLIVVDADLSPSAVANASPSGGLEPLNVQFNGTASGGNGALSYFWNFQDGTNSTSLNPSHSFSAGTYNVSFTVTDGDSDSASDYVLITVDADLTPASGASASPSSGLEPLNVQFNGTASGGNAPLSYLWNFQDGTNSTSLEPTHSFSAGTFNVSFKVTDNDGDSSTSYVLVSVTADLQPTANGSGSPISGLEPLQVEFTGNFQPGNGPHATLWQFQDGSNSSSQNVNHTFSAGTYNVSFTVTDNDNDASTNYVLIIVDADVTPTSGASASPSSGLAPLNVQFNGTASGGNGALSYLWDFKDGTNSSALNPSHSFSAGTYNVSFTVTDSDSDSASDYVLITVDADLTPSANPSASPTSGNAPLLVQFNGTFSSGNAPFSYQWKFGDGGTSTSQNPVHNYSSSGVYTANFTVTDNDGDSSLGTVVINVTAPSSADLIITGMSFLEYTNSSNYTNVVINATVYNQGGSAAGSFYTLLTGAPFWGNGYAFSSGLAAGTSQEVSVSLSCPNPFNSTSAADVFSSVSESNEGNNNGGPVLIDCII